MVHAEIGEKGVKTEDKVYNSATKSLKTEEKRFFLGAKTPRYRAWMEKQILAQKKEKKLKKEKCRRVTQSKKTTITSFFIWKKGGSWARVGLKLRSLFWNEKGQTKQEKMARTATGKKWGGV